MAGNPFPTTTGAWQAMKEWWGNQNFGGSAPQLASIPQGATYSEEPSAPTGPMYAVAMPYNQQQFAAVPQGSFQAQPAMQMKQDKIAPRGAVPAPKMPAQPKASSGDSQDYASLLRDMFNKGNENAQAKRDAAKSLDPYMQFLGSQEAQLDLSPMLALIDSRTGSNISSGYARPKSGEDRAKEMMQLKNNLAQMGIDANDVELAALKDLATGTFGLEKFAYQKERDKVGDRQTEEQLTQGWAKLSSDAAKTGKPVEPKDSQYLASLYGKRMEDANTIFNKIYSNPAALKYATSFKGAVDRSRLTPAGSKEGSTKQISQAERNFINATLRRESGAAIADSEYESAELQYFPRWGDDEATLAQKAQNRERAIEGMRIASGPAWSMYSEGGSTNAPTTTTITPEQARAELARRKGL